MAVGFPGINAPIPENADERLWEFGLSSSDPFRNQSHRRLNHSSEPGSRWHHHEQRRSWDFIDDGPPGVDLAFSPSVSSYPPRHHNYDYNYSSDSSRGPTPTFARPHSDRGRRSSLVYEDFVSHSSPYSSSNKRSSPQDTGSARFRHETDDRRDGYALNYSFRVNDDYDRHRHRSWR